MGGLNPGMRLGPSSVSGSWGCFSGGERRKASFSAPRTSLPTDMDEAAGDPRRPDLPPSPSLTRVPLNFFEEGKKRNAQLRIISKNRHIK